MTKATEAADGFAEALRLNWRQRLWRQLGFGTCGSPDPWPEDLEGFYRGYMSMGVFAAWDWRDRLRILISGKTMANVSIKTNVRVDRIESATNCSVLPPGWRGER